jgi:hypothetical protein
VDSGSGSKEKSSALQRIRPLAGDQRTPSGHGSHSREPDRMEVFALVIWMLIGGDFQEIRWPGMSEAE